MLNKDWTYRKLYNWHCLIHLPDNRIVEISPALAKLFSNYDGNYTAWKNDLQISDETGEKCLKILVSNGILYEQNI